MGGKIVPAVFDRLPCRVVPLYFELDGTFPNHPADPIQPENLRDLQAAVVREHADVGLAFDGDADRVFLDRREGRAGVREPDDGARREADPARATRARRSSTT